MNSLECKVKVLHYFRFKRRYLYIATEAGKFNSDILISDGEQIIEVEVKISISDLKNEIKKKKHKIYASPTSYYSKFLPNYFIFAVPESMLEKAKKYIRETDGLISIFEKPIGAKSETYCKIIKKPKLITEKFSVSLHYELLLRMGSELIRGRLKELKLSKSFN